MTDKATDVTVAQADWTEWAWFVGPHEDEFPWGRYSTRQQAIDEGMIQFAEHRNLEKVISRDD